MKTTFRASTSTIVMALGVIIGGVAVYEYWRDAHLDLLVERPIRNLGEVAASQEVILEFVVFNDGDRDQTVVGSNDRCDSDGCSVTKGLPLTVPAKGQRSFRIEFVAPSAGPFLYKLQALTDCETQPSIELQISGTVKGNSNVKGTSQS